MVHFKRILAVAVLALAGRFAYLTWRVAEGKSVSVKSVAEASVTASKPRFYSVSAPWCTICTIMDATTMKDPAVLEEMKKFDFRKIVIDDFDELGFYPELRGLDLPGVPAYVIVETK